jgi:hypothetical protein
MATDDQLTQLYVLLTARNSHDEFTGCTTGKIVGMVKDSCMDVTPILMDPTFTQLDAIILNSYQQVASNVIQSVMRGWYIRHTLVTKVTSKATAKVTFKAPIEDVTDKVTTKVTTNVTTNVTPTTVWGTKVLVQSTTSAMDAQMEQVRLRLKKIKEDKLDKHRTACSKKLKRLLKNKCVGESKFSTYAILTNDISLKRSIEDIDAKYTYQQIFEIFNVLRDFLNLPKVSKGVSPHLIFNSFGFSTPEFLIKNSICKGLPEVAVEKYSKFVSGESKHTDIFWEFVNAIVRYN